MLGIVKMEMKYADPAGTVIARISVLSASRLQVLAMASGAHVTCLCYLFYSPPTLSCVSLTASDTLASLLSSEHTITCSLWGFCQEWSSSRLSFTQTSFYSVLSTKGATGPLPIYLIFILCCVFYAIFVITW